MSAGVTDPFEDIQAVGVAVRQTRTVSCEQVLNQGIAFDIAQKTALVLAVISYLVAVAGFQMTANERVPYYWPPMTTEEVARGVVH